MFPALCAVKSKRSLRQVASSAMDTILSEDGGLVMAVQLLGFMTSGFHATLPRFISQLADGPGSMIPLISSRRDQLVGEKETRKHLLLLTFLPGGVHLQEEGNPSSGGKQLLFGRQ